jgi:hypothetical protein
MKKGRRETADMQKHIGSPVQWRDWQVIPYWAMTPFWSHAIAGPGPRSLIIPCTQASACSTCVSPRDVISHLLNCDRDNDIEQNNYFDNHTICSARSCTSTAPFQQSRLPR